MNIDKSAYDGNATKGACRIDGWILARGLILLSSALLSITMLHYVVRAVL